jgi:secondary thiamine-phosphate synthase enzyme
MEIKVRTTSKRQVVDITDQLESDLSGSGLVNVFVKHTTAAITAADLDPGTDQDYLDALASMTPDKRWGHPHDPSHFPDHLWSSIIGPELTVPFKEGKLQLGTWQRLILIELDGPRERQIELTLIKA